MTDQAERATRPTSFDVAKLAGVSRSAVSHILNGRGARFPEETRERVMAAAEQLRYRPSPAGRALVMGHSGVIVLLVPHATFGANLQDAVDEVTRVTSAHGLNVVVRFASEDTRRTLISIQDLDPVAVVDMGVLSDEDRGELASSGTIVLPDLSGGPRENQIDPAIAELALDELLARGPRRLLYAAIEDTRRDAFGPGRYQALVDEATRRGLEPPVRVRVPLDADGALSALSPHLEPGDPVGVSCYNDEVALAVLAAGRALGIPTPDRLAVIGVDHTRFGQLTAPRLTTVSIDMRGIMDLLLSELPMLEQPPGQKSAAPVLPVLIRGETT